MENRAVDFTFDGSNLIINIDPNKNGQILMSIKIDLAEIPDEVMNLIAGKKAE